MFLAGPLWAETVFLDATQDNTLYESLEGDISNGAGDHFFVGRTAVGEKRRGLIAFKNLNVIPPGATIKSVKLSVHLSREETPPYTINLLRVQANWGEGASDAVSNEGPRAFAQAGDATWVHRFYDGQTWTQPGGDFSEAVSALLSVGGQGTHTFESNGMVADVQDWVDNPGSNFGWILNGDEAITSAKRFDSRTNPDTAYNPLLEVEYTATGTSVDYSGVWYDPSLDGEGYLVYQTPYGWLVYYFGYSAAGEFKLQGPDGNKTSNVSKLVGVEGSLCLGL